MNFLLRLVKPVRLIASAGKKVMPDRPKRHNLNLAPGESSGGVDLAEIALGTDQVASFAQVCCANLQMRVVLHPISNLASYACRLYRCKKDSLSQAATAVRILRHEPAARIDRRFANFAEKPWRSSEDSKNATSNPIKERTHLCHSINL